MSREERNIRARAWYAKNKERLLAERRAGPPIDHKAAYQKRKRYMRQYYKDNYSAFAARSSARTKLKREECAAYGREYRARGGHMISRCKLRAARKELEYDLTKAWIEQRLAAGVCELSGLPFTSRGEKGPRAPSIDRRDAARGYTQDNCRVIVWALNAAFNDWGQEATEEVWRAYLQRKDSRV